jgi:hypothetical protein
MDFSELLNTPYSDILLVAVCVALAYFVRYRLRGIVPSTSGWEDRGRKPIFALGGLALFLSAFLWCGIALAFGVSDVGISLVPALVLSGLGWVILIANSIWVQRHPFLVAVVGIVGVLGSAAWLLISAGALSQSNPQNFYLIFYPPILGITASALAIATPAFCWFFRMTGVIAD